MDQSFQQSIQKLKEQNLLLLANMEERNKLTGEVRNKLEKIKAVVDDLNNKINTLKDNISGLVKNYHGNSSQIQAIQAELVRLQEQNRVLQEEKRMLDGQLTEKEAFIRNLNAEVEQLKKPRADAYLEGQKVTEGLVKTLNDVKTRLTAAEDQIRIKTQELEACNQQIARNDEITTKFNTNIETLTAQNAEYKRQIDEAVGIIDEAVGIMAQATNRTTEASEIRGLMIELETLLTTINKNIDATMISMNGGQLGGYFYSNTGRGTKSRRSKKGGRKKKLRNRSKKVVRRRTKSKSKRRYRK